MEQKYKKIYIDWWKIKASTIYGAVSLIVFLALLIGGGYWLWQNDWVIAPPADSDAPKDSARIVSFQGDVRIIRVSSRKTERVIKSTFVQAGDTIQTQSDGRAQVRMIDGSMLSIRPNSTVVVRDSTSLFGGTSVRVKLNDGQIKVKTEDQPDTAQNIVEVKETQNRVLPQTEASFNLNEKTDRSEIRINRGGVESNLGGQKTVIKQDEYVAVDKGSVSSKETLLKPPVLVNPSSAKQILSSSSGKATISFRWNKPKAKATYTYQIQVSESPFFVKDKIVYERESLSSVKLDLGNLSPATYFWRVRASSNTGQTSEWSDFSRFTIIKRETASTIEASDWEVEYLGGRLYRISGNTKPGTTVKILDRETFAKSDGSFLLQISTSSSSVAVEVFDEEGNSGRYNLNLKTGKPG